MIPPTCTAGLFDSQKAYCWSRPTTSSAGGVVRVVPGASSSLSLVVTVSKTSATLARVAAGFVMGSLQRYLICATLRQSLAILVASLCGISTASAAAPADAVAAPPAVGSGLRRRRFGTVVSDMAGRSNEPHALLRFKGKGYGEIHQRDCSLWYAPVG